MTAITAKPSLGELEAILRDEAQVTDLVKNSKLGEFLADMERARTDSHADLVNVVKEQSVKATVDFLKESGATIKRLDNSNGENVRGENKRIARGKGVVYNRKAPGAAIDRLDTELRPDDLSEYLQAISDRRDELAGATGVDLRAKFNAWQGVRNAYGSTVPSDGGFLVPEELRSELLSTSLENSIVRPRATVIPMSSATVPIPAVDESSHASHLFGGVIAYWAEEGSTATATSAKFAKVKLEAKKLVIYAEAPNELLADSAAFEAWLSANMPAAAAWFEDKSFLRGSGVGEPLGVLNAGNSALVAVARTASGNAIEYQDIANVYARLLPGSYANAVWVCSPEVIGDLLTMTTGTGGVPLWLTGGTLIDGAPTQILGRPLYVSEKVADRAAQGDLSLIDFSKYLIGDRQVLQAKQSDQFKFNEDLTAFRLTERVDGRPGILSALTPYNGGDSLSPFVTVAA